VVASSHPGSAPGDVVWAYPMDGVWIVEIPGLQRALAHVVVDAISLALAETPRGVVGHIRSCRHSVGDTVLSELASLGRYVDRWPGAPIVMSSADLELSGRIRARPYGDRLSFASSLLQAWAHIRLVDPPVTATLGIRPHPVAGDVAERFGIGTCRDWGMPGSATPTGEIARELTSCAVDDTREEVDLLLNRHQNKIRVGVRSHAGPTAAFPRRSDLVGDRIDRQVAGVPTTTLPMADGRTFTWAVVGA
jgi:hypothetical protein